MEIIVLKFFATSALLMAFYHFALRKKASYRATRIYLLLLPVASLLMSVLTFEVYAPSQSPVAVLSQPQAPVTAPMAMFQVQGMPIEMGPASVSESQAPALSPVEFTPSAMVDDIPFWQKVDWLKLLELSVPGISAILLLIAFYYIMKLMVVKSRMKAETTEEGYAIIRSTSVHTPFSFAKTIFFPADLDKEKESLIIRHEKAHIAHRHYVDVWVSEFFTRIFWFNPFVWLCRSALRNVHEFEADHDVIASGASVLSYQTTLLDMVLNESCPVVSGFNHSFIRSRFIEMRASTAGTLGRFGKIGTLVCLLAMFCVFTFVECSPKDTKNNTLESIQLKEPQKFVIKGIVDPGCTDSCYMITLSDEYLHLADTPSVCIPVVDNKFHYEIDLKQIICGKIQRVLPDGGLDKGIELFFVPGETLYLKLNSDYYNYTSTEEFESKVARGIGSLRYTTNWESPYLPKIKGDVWNNPSGTIKGNVDIYVKDVYFNKDETVVRFVSDVDDRALNSDMILSDKSCLKDNNGNIYKFKRAVMTNINDIASKEMVVFGQFVAFEPMPKDVESFSYVTNDSTYIGPKYGYYQEQRDIISNIYKVNEDLPEDNFSLIISLPDTTKYSGMILSVQKDNFQSKYYAELPIKGSRKIAYDTYLSEDKMFDITFVNPDGTTEPFWYSVPFIPGEIAKVSFINTEYRNQKESSTFNSYVMDVDGTSFYRQWKNATEYVDNIIDGNKQDAMLEYVKKHSDEYGSVMYFLSQTGLNVYSIMKYIPEDISSKKLVQSEKARYDLKKRQEELSQKFENLRREKEKNSLPGMMFTDFSAINNEGGTVKLSDYVGKGKYVLLNWWYIGVHQNNFETINDILNQYGDKIDAVGVPIGLEKDEARRFAEVNGAKYPQLYDVNGEARISTYYVVRLPETFLFGPDGTILKRGLTSNDVRDAVEEYIK